VTEGAPSTIELSVPLDGEAAEAVCALFEEHGGGAVVETRMDGPGGRPEHWVRTYIAASDVEARARIEVGLWHLSRIYPIPEAAVRTLATNPAPGETATAACELQAAGATNSLLLQVRDTYSAGGLPGRMVQRVQVDGVQVYAYDVGDEPWSGWADIPLC
jgi:hypothetical protein